VLTMTVSFGDEVVIQTPSGDVRVLVGGAKRDRRRISIDAPRTWQITRRGKNERSPAAPPSTPNKRKGINVFDGPNAERSEITT